MTISLCILVSNPDFSLVDAALRSALTHVKADEVLIGISPKITQEKVFDYTLKDVTDIAVELRPGAKIKVRGGTDDRAKLARVRFALFQAASCDWIVSIDDDDLVLGPLPLDTAGPKVAFVHSDVRARYLVDQSDGSFRAGETQVRKSKGITDARDANYFRGSYYAYRRDALMVVLDYVDRASMHYEEWRVVWHLIKKGWTGLYVPKVLQEQGCRDVPALVAATRAEGRSWLKTVDELDEIFSNRWWQRWRQQEARGSVEKFWHNDPNQVARRKQFNSILRDVVKSAEAKTVLDFGCGTGEDYLFMSGELNLTYKGVDVTREMLDTARKKFPIIDVDTDDLFSSKQGDQSHPFVVNSAVLPHLPEDRIPVAISELWRITSKVLVVRLFGVGNKPTDETLVRSGFIYQRWTEATWKRLFNKCSPARLVVHRGDVEATKDIMVVELWR